MLRSNCLRLTMWRAEEWTSWLPDRPHPVLSRKRGGAWGPEGSVQLCREQPPALTHTSPCLEFSPGQLACLLSLSLVAFGNHILATTAPGSSFWPCLTVLHLIKSHQCDQYCLEYTGEILGGAMDKSWFFDLRSKTWSLIGINITWIKDIPSSENNQCWKGTEGRKTIAYSKNWKNFRILQSFSCVRLFVTPWTTAHQASLSITNSQSSPKPMSIESVMPSISSFVVPFSFCPQSFPASGSFQMSQLFTSGGQSIGASASASVLPMNTQDWSPLGWTGWISLQSKGLSTVFSNTTVENHRFFGTWLSL